MSGQTRAAPPIRLNVAGCLASGILLTLAFPGPDLGWIVWVALVPLLLSIRNLAPGPAFRLGFLTGLVAYGGLMAWISLFGLPAWIMLTAGMALYFGAFAAGAALLAGTRRDGILWTAPLTWVAVEVVRSVGPLGFPWGLLGLTQYRSAMMLPLASVLGVFGLSGVIVLVNTLLAHMMATRRVSRGAFGAFLVVVGAVLVAVTRPAPIAEGQRIVAAIQPNVPPRARADPNLMSQLIAGLLAQTSRARMDGAEIIVYPETAVPTDLEEVPDLRMEIAQRAGGAVIIAGTFLSGPRNAAMVIGPDGRALGRYAKRRLVPFGEAGLRPGRETAPVATPNGVVGILICYESTFPGLARTAVASGADLIAILTNDGWFGTSAGPGQHAAHAVLRAVETGRTVVRAANTGTSMLIAPNGQVVGAIPLGTSGVLAAVMPVGGPLTPYVRWGWLFAPLAVAAWLAAVMPMAAASLARNARDAWRLGALVLIPAIFILGAAQAGIDLRQFPVPVALGLLALSLALGRGTLSDRRGVVRSAIVSLAATALLLMAMREAYGQYGFYMPIGPPDGRWLSWTATAILNGVAAEVWLRGAVFAAAARLGGWPLAMALSTALGIAIRVGEPQEIVFWHLLTGVVFAAIRIWTNDAAGLGPARGVGDAVIAGLANLR